MKKFKEVDINKVLEARSDPKKAKIMIKAIQKIKLKLIKNKGKILNELIKMDLIKKEEKLKYSQDYLAEYLNFVAYAGEVKKDVQIPAFVTTSKDILGRREELEGRFNVKIKDPLEMVNLMKREYDKIMEYIG